MDVTTPPAPPTQLIESAGPVVALRAPTLSAALMAASPSLHAKLARLHGDELDWQAAMGGSPSRPTFEQYLFDILHAFAWGDLQ